ncbi:hypothetical protein [uncultured Clostridium sp.]|uniref:hypothetical protein n=1 Tax=uncultured Clostridium sp. TaxID=59620 RepID=UPI0028E737B7|nr:hypothetical protein [uncultured Clostridium sp.]
MKYADYIYKKCVKCGLEYNVSIKDKQKNYVCDKCERKAKKPVKTKVLMKNKNKFCI